MDISNHDHKLPNSNWDIIQPYNMAMEAHNNMLDHHHHHEIIPFDHTQWPNYPPLPQNLPQPSNSTPTHLLPPPENLLHQPGDHFKLETGEQEDGPEEELGSMKEMMFKIAAMQPVDIDPSTIRKPKRRNVRISDDPQSVAARHRRERISEKIRVLQRLVPGGTKMDTASMLDEAIRYVKFLKRQIRVLQGNNNNYYPSNGVHEVGPTSAGDEDWAGAGTSSYNVFGGNNNVHDGSFSHDGPICFNNKFTGHD